MKKKFFATITLLVLFFEPHAQSEKNKIIFGIKGRFNHTVINGYETNGAKTGFIGPVQLGKSCC